MKKDNRIPPVEKSAKYCGDCEHQFVDEQEEFVSHCLLFTEYLEVKSINAATGKRVHYRCSECVNAWNDCYTSE